MASELERQRCGFLLAHQTKPNLLISAAFNFNRFAVKVVKDTTTTTTW
jgi:hypothetical protein